MCIRDSDDGDDDYDKFYYISELEQLKTCKFRALLSLNSSYRIFTLFVRAPLCACVRNCNVFGLTTGYTAIIYF